MQGQKTVGLFCPMIVVTADNGVQQVADWQESVLMVSVVTVMAMVAVMFFVREAEHRQRTWQWKV